MGDIALLLGTSLNVIIISDDITFTSPPQQLGLSTGALMTLERTPLSPTSHLGAAPTSVMLNPNILRAGHNPPSLLRLSCDIIAPLISWLFTFSLYQPLLFIPQPRVPILFLLTASPPLLPYFFLTPFWQSPSPKLIQLFPFSVPLSRILGAVGGKKITQLKTQGTMQS